MMNLKIGVMPGKLVEVVVNKGASAREIFETANVEISNHEIRLDGNKIDIEDNINDGRLLVAMKQIKGNANTIKVGVMPGKLQVVEYEIGELAENIFDKAGIEISNHEIRLDGTKIDLDEEISEGNLLVAMKQIKGNTEIYYTECTKDEVETLLGVPLPTSIHKDEIQECSDIVIINGWGVDKEMFNSIYELKEELVDWNNPSIFTPQLDTTAKQEEHVCTCNNKVEEEKNRIKEIIEKQIENEQEELSRWNKYIIEQQIKIDALLGILDRI